VPLQLVATTAMLDDTSRPLKSANTPGPRLLLCALTGFPAEGGCWTTNHSKPAQPFPCTRGCLLSLLTWMQTREVRSQEEEAMSAEGFVEDGSKGMKHLILVGACYLDTILT